MKFVAEDDRLVVQLNWSETVASLKHSLNIPRSAIVDLQWLPEYSLPGRIWRFGGTDIPGALYAGHFLGNGNKYFLYLLRPKGGLTWLPRAIETQNTLVITTQGYPFKQILLTCDTEIGASLMSWWRSAN